MTLRALALAALCTMLQYAPLVIRFAQAAFL